MATTFDLAKNARYSAGFEVGLKGGTSMDCPYVSMTVEFYDWFAGYSAAIRQVARAAGYAAGAKGGEKHNPYMLPVKRDAWEDGYNSAVIDRKNRELLA